MDLEKSLLEFQFFRLNYLTKVLREVISENFEKLNKPEQIQMNLNL